MIHRRFLARRTFALLPSALLLLSAFGCGSSSGTKAGTISVTDPTGAATGQLKSLSIGRSATLVMTPINAGLNAGVDWTVTCGGSPTTGSITGGACGTLSPAHTSGGSATTYTAPPAVPLGTSVTITASVTSDPSAISTVTLAITPAAITIAFLGNPPTSVIAGSMTQFRVQLTNDSTAAGATWSASCGSSACGSFNPVTTASQASTIYTAPAAVPSGGTVTITATSVANSSASATTTVTIEPAPMPISVTIGPSAIQLGASATAGLIASVANDSSNAGVDWAIACASTIGVCGKITPTHTESGAVATYTAPSTASGVNPVTISATATATESATPIAANVTATITAASSISVVLSATPTALTPLATSQLSATVKKDTSNAGVTWSVACNSSGAGACGTISKTAGSGANYTATYTAPSAIPAGGLVTVSATSVAASAAGAVNNPGLATISIAAVPPTISFLTSPPASITANAQVPVSAVVANDVAPGGVTWTVQCGSTVAGGCGYIQPYQSSSATNVTYTAPPVPPAGTTTALAAGQVAIVATSTADNTVSVTSTPVTIAPATALSVRFVPYAPSQLEAAATVNLIAAVANDATNAGVDWQVCASGCGFFTTTPAIPAIAATATTPFVPAVPAVTKTSVTGWPNGLPIPYTAPPSAPQGGSLLISATATATDQTAVTTSAVAPVVITTLATGPAVTGVVQAGTQAVVGASVSLYAAGTSGYGSPATLIYSPQSAPTATTGKDGSFTLAAGYSCPQPASQMYLVAAGGQVGDNGPNPNLTMMTALGSCSNLSSVPVVVNEVTTVASAAAIAQFAANDSLTGNSSYLYLGAPSTNLTGLQNAFASVDNLVDITTGQAILNTPAGNAAVPYAEINTLADVLNTCTATGGGVEGDGSACGTLFSDADTLGYQSAFPSTPPTDTLQAAISIAQHPSASDFGYQTSITSLFPLATLASPFQPILNAAPVDFSISLNFTGGGGLSTTSTASSFALDAFGNLWITDTTGNRIIEWNDAGTPVSPSSGFTTTSLIAPGPVAIDTSGDVWICDSNGLTVINSLATEIQGSPFIGGGLSGTCQGSAFDGLGNLWANNSSSVSKFSNLGAPLSPSTGYTIPVSPTSNVLATPLAPIAIDDSGDVWVGVNDPSASGPLYLAELDNGSGAPNFLSPIPPSGPPLNLADTTISDLTQPQIAINSSGAVWVPGGITGTPLQKVSPYAGAGTTDQVTAGFSPAGGSQPFINARGVSIDGANFVWVGSTGAAGSNFLPSGLTKISNSSNSNYAHYNSPSLVNLALAVAIDSSGNVWVLLDNNTVTEYVGLATPAVTPLAAAVKNKKLGAKP